MAFWGVLALIILALCSFLCDWTMVSKCGTIDYRNRVTGVRLLMSGLDPYHYKWNRGEPERFCDPYENPKLTISKTTVTPAMLMVGWPWAALPYPLVQILWLLAEWGMLAGLWFVWFSWPGITPRGRWWWSVLVVGFTYTLAWRHHVDRGQAYVMWALLLSGWMRLGLEKPSRKSGWMAGLLGGVLVALRPPLLLVIAPFLVLRRRNQWLGAALGLLFGLGAPVLLKHSVWQDYGRAMETWSSVYRADSEPRPGPRAFPAKIEDMPVDQLGHFEVTQYADSSIFRLLRTWGWHSVPDKAVLAGLCLVFGLWLWRSRGAGDPVFLLGLAAWSFLSDAFLPAYRNPYNDVMILNTLALVTVTHRLERTFYLLALLATLLGIWIVNIQPPERWWIYLPTLATASVAVLALQQSVRLRPGASNPPPA